MPKMSAQLPLELPEETLAQARRGLEAGLNKGVKCPCCGQFAKRYKRKLTGSMVASLLVLLRYSRRQGQPAWVHYQSHVASLRPAPKLALALRAGMASYLRYWGLIELKPEAEAGSKDEKVRGYFRITPLGIEFALGHTTVPKFASVYNNVCGGTFGPAIDVHEALTERFDYGELMRF